MRKFNFRKLIVSLVLAAMIVSMNMTCAFATGGTGGTGGFGEDVTINTGGGDAGALMGKIIGILLTITRYVGVALVIYGVYEVVMSFMQNQPEAKTKGIIMALAGVAMIALKSILAATGIIT